MTAEPTRRRGLWYGLAAVVVVVVTLVSGGTVVTWLLEQHEQHTKEYANVDVRTVQVIAPNASVRIYAGPNGTASVTQNLSWVTAKPSVVQDFDAATGTLTVDVNCDSQGKFLAGTGSCSAQIDIQVPTATSVHARTDSGETAVNGLTGAVDAEATSGDLQLNTLSGAVTARVSSGSIAGSNLLSAQVSADARSGSVDLDFAQTPTRVTTKVSSGAISLTLPRGSHYRVDTSVGSGEASVDPGLADSSAPGSVTAKATSGAISIGYR